MKYAVLSWVQLEIASLQPQKRPKELPRVPNILVVSPTFTEHFLIFGGAVGNNQMAEKRKKEPKMIEIMM